MLFGLRSQRHWLTQVSEIFSRLNLQIVDLQTVVVPLHNGVYVLVFFLLLLLARSLRSAPLTTHSASNSDQEHQVLVSYMFVENSDANQKLRQELRSLTDWQRPLGVYSVFATEDGDITYRRRAVMSDERGHPAFSAAL